MASLIEGLAGTQLGTWSLESMLGKPGAFSVVYCARPISGGDACAMKLLKPERYTDAQAEFEREGELLLQMQHAQNVVTILEANGMATIGLQVVGTGNAVQYPVRYHRLELADGCLDEIVALHIPQNWDLRLQLLRDVVAGVHQLHLGGIVHRDLKSSNVLLFSRRPAGQQGQIADLGRSCRIADLPSLPAHAYSIGRGDPACAPPELILGFGVPNEVMYRQADLYLIGSVLCELATGQPATSLLVPDWQAMHLRGKAAPPGSETKVVRAERAALRPQLERMGNLVRSVAPAAIRVEMAALFMQLCDPDPSLRDVRHRRDQHLPRTDLAWLLRRVDIIRRQLALSQPKSAKHKV